MFRMSSSIRLLTMAVAFASLITNCPADEGTSTSSPKVLNTSTEQQKFTYYFFYRENSAATKDSLRSLQSNLEPHSEKAGVVSVNVTDPAERETVTRFKVSRSPMPLVVAVAPNGAVTGASNTISSKWISDTLVTPHMTECMKSMQSGKLVLLCVQGSSTLGLPAGVREFVADPHFQQRTAVVTMQTTDPNETRFLKELDVPATSSNATIVVLMAPPGVLVGKYLETVTGQQLAGELAAQGKCCNDPNCKHNKKRK